MGASRIPLRHPEIAWRVIDEEAVVVNPRSGIAYPFNPVATRCWELADGSRSIEKIIETIAKEFEAPKSQIAADVGMFFDELEIKGLVGWPKADGAGAGNGRL